MDKIQRGYLVSFSVGDGIVGTYDNMVQLAATSKLPDIYLPKQRSARMAWEKATSLPRRGVNIAVSDKKISQIKKSHDVIPYVRIESKVISDKAPILRKSLLRLGIIPFADDDGGDNKKKEKCLAVDQVGMLEFVVSTSNASAFYYPDKGDWVDKDAIQKLVDQIKANQEALQNHIVGEDIRLKIRQFLADCNRVPLVKSYSGYYIPESEGVYERLLAMRAFIQGLEQFSDESPQAYVFKIYGEDDIAQSDLIKASVSELQSRLFALRDEVQEHVENPPLAKPNTAKIKRFYQQMTEIKESAELLKKNLGNKMTVLDALFDSVAEAVIKAQGA